MKTTSRTQKNTQNFAGYLASLSQNEQTVIALHYLEKLSWTEVAEVIGLAEEIVTQMHNGAMRKLQILMMRQGNCSERQA